MKPIIEVKGLSKRYKLGVFNAKTLREEAEAFLARFKRQKLKGRNAENLKVSPLATRHTSLSSQSNEFWALRDVSFDVQPGEVIGIIGRNGAGTQAATFAARETDAGSPQGETPCAGINSTLLKILSRITEPTSGEARIRGRGRVGALGAGFNPILLGREPRLGEDRPTAVGPKGEAAGLASQNIFLNGAILGMTKAEIRSKFDEIIGFAGIRKLINTQVQNYRWTA